MPIYSKLTNHESAVIGNYTRPVKMLIENESDLMKKKGGVCDWLFNVEESNNFGETVISQAGFDIFKPTREGDGAENDSVTETHYKFIEHIQYMKEFTISAEMMEDAKFGIAHDAKRRIQNFVRSYYNTINKACAHSLINATLEESDFAGTTLNHTTLDGNPLFFNDHHWGFYDRAHGHQSNYFWGNITKTGASNARAYSIDTIEETLYNLANILRCMKDENGDPMGYVADTIILPTNKPELEHIVKKICGSEMILASANNDINVHYGRWNVIILPTWAPERDEIMVMSSEANKALAGNMFFNRVPLTISSWIDHHSGNYNWTGRCRFGIGFGNYKHIVRAVDSTSEIDNATAFSV